MVFAFPMSCCLVLYLCQSSRPEDAPPRVDLRAFPWKTQAHSPAFHLVMSMCGTLSARHALYPGVRPRALNQRRPLVVQETGGR